jgi:hypothetical protein
VEREIRRIRYVSFLLLLLCLSPLLKRTEMEKSIKQHATHLLRWKRTESAFVMDWPDSGSCADCANCATSKNRTPRKDWDTRRRQRHRQARIHESQEKCFNKAYRWLQKRLTYIRARSNDVCALHKINSKRSGRTKLARPLCRTQLFDMRTCESKTMWHIDSQKMLSDTGSNTSINLELTFH